jgi:hypothetical protein
MGVSKNLQPVKKQSLLSDFDSILGPRIENKIPDGFYTVEQVAQEIGLSKVRTQDRLYQATKTKKISRIKGRNAEGRVCWFYRVK